MQKSMTGYGIARLQTETKAISVEVKTLNSKFLDANIRLPYLFSHKELEVKNLLSQRLIRGKASISINYQNKSSTAQRSTINQEMAAFYKDQLQEAASALGLAVEDSALFKQVMSMPDVTEKQVDEDGLEDEWTILKEQIVIALESCDKFRIQEGEAVTQHIMGCGNEIERLAGEISNFEQQRTAKLRQRLTAQTDDVRESEHFNTDRFEQELIFYIEKLDISEEQSRLKNHLKYFRETVGDTAANGKKLNFIAQEIGREVNTIGSKANDSDIQKIVVQMKDNLEQIKEQVLNIL